jgi:hypothetical protein
MCMKLAGLYTWKLITIHTTICLAETPFWASNASCTLSSPTPTTQGFGAATNVPSAIASGKYRSNNARLMSFVDHRTPKHKLASNALHLRLHPPAHVTRNKTCDTVQSRKLLRLRLGHWVHVRYHGDEFLVTLDSSHYQAAYFRTTITNFHSAIQRFALESSDKSLTAVLLL